MSQNDFSIANQSGSAFRADVNSALQALASCSAGATAPSTPYAYMLWADTANDLLKQRNAANSAWISLAQLSTGGAVAVSGAVVAPANLTQPISSGTVWTYTSGTPSSIDFTGIPSWAKRISVTMNGISGAAALVGRIRLGTSGGLVTTGYSGALVTLQTTPAISSADLGSSPEGICGFATGAAGSSLIGRFVLEKVTGNTWLGSGMVHRQGDATLILTNASITLGGTLDRLSLVATTSTFDAGSANIIYE